MVRLIDDSGLLPTEAVIGDRIVWVVPYRDIYEAPTVDAIPIEWLIEQAKSWDKTLECAESPSDIECIKHIQSGYYDIIDEWRKHCDQID